MKRILTIACLVGLSSRPCIADGASASTGANQLAIVTISVSGRNLVLNASVPAAVEQLTLERRLALNAEWEEQGQLEVQAGIPEIEFMIPKPTNSMAFFRLKGKTRESASVVSDPMRYVTMPSLESNRGMNGEALFHFKGQVDGSDKIVITRDGALWFHVNWGWPAEAVTINGTKWNPEEKNFLTSAGGRRFLPESFSLEAVRLEVLKARDVVAIERGTNALIVYLNDTPNGSDEYEFAIHFERAGPKADRRTTTPARLKISARIDGSDRIKITQTEAKWEHNAWREPAEVTLNGIPWSPDENHVLKNKAAHRFLPAGVDLSTARIVARKGRDLATMWAEEDAVWVLFGDNPGADDAYEVEIAFGQDGQ